MSRTHQEERLTSYLRQYRKKILSIVTAVIICLSLPLTLEITRAQTPQPLSPSATDAAWSPDGSQLAVAGNFGIVLYSSDFQLSQRLSVKGVSRLAWSPDGKYIASD